MSQPATRRPWITVRHGLIGLLVLGGLAAVFVAALAVKPELRESLITWRLKGLTTDNPRDLAHVVSLRYEPVSRMLVLYVVPAALIGLFGGMLLSRLFIRAGDQSYSIGINVLLAIVTLTVILTVSFPRPRGLVYVAEQDQFSWLEQLEQGNAEEQQLAVEACTQLLNGPPFYDRSVLIAALAKHGAAAKIALPVLRRLQHDGEENVRNAAEIAFLKISESWPEQVRHVREGKSRRIELTQYVVTDDELRELATDCAGLEVLLLDDMQCTSETLELVLPALPHLRRLKLGGPVAPAAFALFANTPTLEVLNLPQADCPDESLGSLKTLPKLNLLRIGSPRITDAGLAQLQEFPSLKYLHLIESSITDTGLETVAELSNLQSFYLDGSQCTAAGLSELLQRRPNLHVHWNDLHLEQDPQAGHDNGESPTSAGQ